mgnify:CR=1 FL=1
MRAHIGVWKAYFTVGTLVNLSMVSLGANKTALKSSQALRLLPDCLTNHNNLAP